MLFSHCVFLGLHLCESIINVDIDFIRLMQKNLEQVLSLIISNQTFIWATRQQRTVPQWLTHQMWTQIKLKKWLKRLIDYQKSCWLFVGWLTNREGWFLCVPCVVFSVGQVVTCPHQAVRESAEAVWVPTLPSSFLSLVSKV